MKRPLVMLALSFSLLAVLVGGSAFADDRIFNTTLISYQETPAVSSTATGTFQSQLSKDETMLTYTLKYSGLQGTVTQSHIHFGQKGVQGGVSVFLCQTAAGVDPTGLAPTCPQDTSAGPVTGTITSANIIGPAGQGIAAGELAELIKAVRAGIGYANVHSSVFPSGEIRGQLR